MKAFRRARRLRAKIRALLEAHPPLLPPLSAKEIRARLAPPRPALRTVQWHVRQIRLAAELADLRADALRAAQFIP
jgi:hypothetical protein